MTEIRETLARLSAPVNPQARDVAVILAAGHGKRIKSSTSKMLHEIWGKPSVVRVAEACEIGLDNPCNVIVVGIKAAEVAAAVAARLKAIFAFQPEQNGTGHAVACALDALAKLTDGAGIYVFPGDMGLLNAGAVREFKNAFEHSGCDMMVMTGVHEGPVEENYYGRIIRVPEKDETGAPAGADKGKVIEIKEHKDILAARDGIRTRYQGRWYRFTQAQLLAIREFNTSVYAFKGDLLRQYIGDLGADNVQGEVYLTDLIAIFNRHGCSIGAVSPSDNAVVLGFNNKSVLRQMEALARQRVYDRLKDIIAFEAPDDFFIADEVVEDLIRLDREKGALDIFIGAGARIEPGVQLNVGATIIRQASLSGHIVLGKNVKIGRNAQLSVYPNQTMKIGDNVEIMNGDILKGAVEIGDGVRIETPVTITGSDEFPVRIGANVLIKGTTYIFGSIIENDVTIHYSVLLRKHIRRIERRDGSIQAIRFYMPYPEGIECVIERSSS
ncbi:MAG: NTP transferase domain-containing protein [Candidatus Sumerlaeota bacterium]|nr:NTP transferase domain-containing protein [Candidatus Sumerlaeota bacterium]